VDDYFKQPVYVEELVSAVNHLIAQRFNGSNSKVGSWTNYCGQTDRLIGKCAQMQAIKSSIIKMARTDSTVLITGETGTGKGLVARLIHENSARHGRPFISVNSAAVPDNLLESELFGFERGAFTGATKRQIGKFELAHGGTLLLDEISELSLHAQAKILHALESHQIYRLGGHCPIELNVRILSATNQDPEQLVVEQKFRKDLFYRLNVARLHLPPLRDRREDIPLLVNYYIQQCNRRFGRQVKGWREEAENFLLEYDWPGNVRELKNLVEACFIHLPDADTEVLDLPEIYVRKLREIEHKSLDERERLLCALFTTNWNVSQAATRLNWSRMTVYRKMERYHLVRPKSGDEEMT
jgi:DNA-binding NtrC family response regulator